jgi:hypothetical protein
MCLVDFNGGNLFTNISTAGMSGYGRIVDPPTGMFAESRDGREVLG